MQTQHFRNWLTRIIVPAVARNPGPSIRNCTTILCFLMQRSRQISGIFLPVLPRSGLVPWLPVKYFAFFPCSAFVYQQSKERAR